MAQRTPEEIRNSIDTHRGELVTSVEACAARSSASPTGALT